MLSSFQRTVVNFIVAEVSGPTITASTEFFTFDTFTETAKKVRIPHEVPKLK